LGGEANVRGMILNLTVDARPWTTAHRPWSIIYIRKIVSISCNSAASKSK
jgi:hypothetical protein